MDAVLRRPSAGAGRRGVSTMTRSKSTWREATARSGSNGRRPLATPMAMHPASPIHQNPQKNPANPIPHQPILVPRSTPKQQTPDSGEIFGKTSSPEDPLLSRTHHRSRNPLPNPKIPINPHRTTKNPACTNLDSPKKFKFQIDRSRSRLGSEGGAFSSPNSRIQQKASPARETIIKSGCPNPCSHRTFVDAVRFGVPKAQVAERRFMVHVPPATSTTTTRPRKVWFINSPSVAIFHRDSAPADIQPLGRPSTRMHMYPFYRHAISKSQSYQIVPCLKMQLRYPQNYLACKEAQLSGSLFLSSHAQKHEALGELNPHPWQFVRKKLWGRSERRRSNYNQTASNRHNIAYFKWKTRGRCYNCLARDHLVAQCRYPTKCWRCGGSGHISSRCRGRAYFKRHHSLESVSLPSATAAQATTLPHKLTSHRSSDIAAATTGCRGEVLCAPKERRRFCGDLSTGLHPNKPCFHKRLVNKTGCTPEQLDDRSTDKYQALKETDPWSDWYRGESPFRRHRSKVTEPRSHSDAIHIVPHEHSPMTQDLETWLNSMASSKKFSSNHQVKTSISKAITTPSSGYHCIEESTQTVEVAERPEPLGQNNKNLTVTGTSFKLQLQHSNSTNALNVDHQPTQHHSQPQANRDLQHSSDIVSIELTLTEPQNTSMLHPTLADNTDENSIIRSFHICKNDVTSAAATSKIPSSKIATKVRNKITHKSKGKHCSPHLKSTCKSKKPILKLARTKTYPIKRVPSMFGQEQEETAISTAKKEEGRRKLPTRSQSQLMLQMPLKKILMLHRGRKERRKCSRCNPVRWIRAGRTRR